MKKKRGMVSPHSGSAKMSKDKDSAPSAVDVHLKLRNRELENLVVSRGTNSNICHKVSSLTQSRESTSPLVKKKELNDIGAMLVHSDRTPQTSPKPTSLFEESARELEKTSVEDDTSETSSQRKNLTRDVLITDDKCSTSAMEVSHEVTTSRRKMVDASQKAVMTTAPLEELNTGIAANLLASENGSSESLSESSCNDRSSDEDFDPTPKRRKIRSFSDHDSNRDDGPVKLIPSGIKDKTGSSTPDGISTSLVANASTSSNVLHKAKKGSKDKSAASDNRRKYKCSHCEKRFISSRHLREHERIHTGIQMEILTSDVLITDEKCSTSAIEVSHEDSDKDDILWNLVKNNEFLQYEQSIEKIKPSRFDFTDDALHSDSETAFSNFGIEVIKDYLHIGLASENSIDGKVKCKRVLLLVWPNFVSPGAYENYKMYLADIKKINTLVFRVPEAVFQKYSEGNNQLHELVAASAILTPVDEWKLLERTVISSFYHITFDKETSDLHGDIHVWNNFPRDKLNLEWKQLLFICCGPQDLTCLVKKMFKRNWARIARDSISSDAGEDKYSVFCTVGVIKLIVEWAKQFFKPDGVVRFLEEINSIKPALGTSEIASKAIVNFSQDWISSKDYRCKDCTYETDDKCNFEIHVRRHTGETPYLCDVCGIGYKQTSQLREHKIKNHTGDYKFRCKYCGKPFIKRESMKFHISVHERKGNVHFKCYKCRFKAEHETGLMQHIPIHVNDPTFDCTVCRKKHDSEFALVAHLRNHSKDKPFNCHTCGRGFLREFDLNRHYNIHSDSRQMFTCQFCNRSLTTMDSLRTHMAAQHGEK